MKGNFDTMKKYVEANVELIQKGVIVHSGGIDIDYAVNEEIAKGNLCVTCKDHTRIY